MLDDGGGYRILGRLKNSPSPRAHGPASSDALIAGNQVLEDQRTPLRKLGMRLEPAERRVGSERDHPGDNGLQAGVLNAGLDAVNIGPRHAGFLGKLRPVEAHGLAGADELGALAGDLSSGFVQGRRREPPARGQGVHARHKHTVANPAFSVKPFSWYSTSRRG